MVGLTAMRALLPRGRLVAGAAAALLIAGCAKPPKAPPPPPPPTSVSASLQAHAGVNPDLRSRPSPIVIRVYELKSTAAFEAADFASLYDRDQATLAAETTGREEFILHPGETKPWEKTLGAEVRYIGVLGAFRDIDRARWKTVVALKPNTRNVITIRAEALSVSAALQ
jgi:type VI secretion system protein VasD